MRRTAIGVILLVLAVRLGAQTPDRPTGTVIASNMNDNTASGRMIAALPSKGRAAHMLALSARGDRMVMANIATAPDGRHAVITDPVKAQVRVFDVDTRHQRFLIQIPAESLLATAEIPGSPSPEGVVVSSDSRSAFVTLQGRNRVATIDLERGEIVALAPTVNWSDGIGYSVIVSRP